MEIAGYIAAALIGLSLGLVGGGGSILTVPVLVYLFGVDAVTATSYSLFIVGSTSLAGAWRNYRKGLVRVRVALMFGLSSITTVWITRRLIIPRIPEHIGHIGGLEITKSLLTIILFAVLMLLASFSMIRGRKAAEDSGELAASGAGPMLWLYGMGIGLVTGFLGAGGGFLLIPALVLLLRLPMKDAVGTSLFIIALNSLIGFTGDLGHTALNWQLLLTLTAIAVGGILLGTRLATTIPGWKLKKGFGWFVLIMGAYILIKELLLR